MNSDDAGDRGLASIREIKENIARLEKLLEDEPPKDFPGILNDFVRKNK